MIPRTLLARTFLLLATLVILTTTAWLSLFRYIEAEPRARETAQLAASAVNLIRAALFAAAPEKRPELFNELSTREGIRLLPAEADDRVEPMPDSRFHRLIQRDLSTRLGPHTRVAAEVDGVAGFWVSFRLDDHDEEEYWLILPRERAMRSVAGHWLLWALLAQALSEGKGGPAPTPAEVGRRWAADHVPTDLSDTPADTPGRWLSKVGRMLDVLLEWGYTPELTTDKGGRAAKVVLDACPFLGQARTNPAVVCGIHRGLIAGALTQFGETDTEVGLEPFVGPTTCVAHVSTRTPFRTIAPTAPNASAPSTTASKEPA